MVCPKCHQTVQARASECCPLCGFALQTFRRRLQAIYSISFAFFASTLVYSTLVYFLETRGLVKPANLPAVVPYILLALAVMQLGIARRIGKPLPQMTSMQQVQTLFLVKLALVEGAAILGVFAFVMTGSLALFVTFLGVSWVGFIVVGAQMPHLVERLAELAVAEEATR
jgi:hypothetical protein